jgi:hypothetical protein
MEPNSAVNFGSVTGADRFTRGTASSLASQAIALRQFSVERHRQAQYRDDT